MSRRGPFRHCCTNPEIIRLAVMLYVRSRQSSRNVEDLLHERGIEVGHEAVRFGWQRLGSLLAAEIRWNWAGMMSGLQQTARARPFSCRKQRSPVMLSYQPLGTPTSE